MRRGFATLAFFAVLSALAQPVCAVQDIHLVTPHELVVAPAHNVPQDSHGQDSCCSAIETDTLVTATPAVDSTSVSAMMATPRAFAHRIARSTPAQPACSAAPPPPLTYHARSARILR